MSEALGGGRIGFLLKIRGAGGGGGVYRTGGVEGPGGCLRRIGGFWGAEGANFFFGGGRNVHQEKKHKHKQVCGIVPGLGGWQKLVYVFFLVIPYGGEKTHKQNPPPRIPGRSTGSFVYVFFLYMFLSAPETLRLLNALNGEDRGLKVRLNFPCDNSI